MPDSIPARINIAGLTQHSASEPAIKVTSPIPTSMASPQIFTQYKDQHEAFTDRLRALHEDERALWKVERQQMLERIKELEDTVKALGGSVEGSLQSLVFQRQSALTNALPLLQPRAGNIASAGNEFWKGAGGHGNSHPARAFSEPSNSSNLAIFRMSQLPAIQETAVQSDHEKSVGFDMGTNSSIEKDFHVHPVPSIPVYESESTFDGVTFKPSALSVVGVSHRSSGTQSPSPLLTPAKEPPGPREPTPMILHLTSSGLTTSDLLVKDAGHTPLARLNDSAPSTTNQGTPKQAAEPAEPEERPVRPPNERAESYFPSSDGVLELLHTKDDPALNEPLALTNKPTEEANSFFLNELDSKLREAQTPDDADEVSEASNSHGESKDTNGTNLAEGEAHLEAEEPEPRLRIKRSTNFGSVFGASNVGKDV